MWPSSWKARMRWSGIARPTWMSGDVTSIPSLTRSGRPSFSFASRPPSGRRFTAFRVRASRPTGGLDYPRTGAVSDKDAPAEAAAHPQAQTSRPPSDPRRAGPGVVHLRTAHRRLGEDPAARPGEAAHPGEHATSTRPTGTRCWRSCAARRRGSSSPSQQISPWMKHAIVAIEDKRFYEHRGIDVRGMARAVWADVTHQGAVQGGSTITQQFVKQAYLTSQKSIGRKLIEAALAWQLERRWTKDQILTAYLNTVYFGNGAYGVEQASRVYFGHGASTLNPAESALAGRHPAGPEPVGSGRAPAVRARSSQRRPRAAVGAGLSDRRPVPRGAPLSDAEPGRRQPSLDAGSRRAVLRELRQGPARPAIRSVPRLRRRAQGDDDARHEPPADGAASRSRRCSPTRTARRRRSSHSTCTRGPCWRWSAARTTTRASSISRHRASASRARPSSRSCSPPRCGRESHPRPSSRRSR